MFSRARQVRLGHFSCLMTSRVGQVWLGHFLVDCGSFALSSEQLLILSVLMFLAPLLLFLAYAGGIIIFAEVSSLNFVPRIRQCLALGGKLPKEAQRSPT